MSFALRVFLAVCLAAGTAEAQTCRSQRLEILALSQTLNAALLAARSATLTLEAWCADHRQASPTTIQARQVIGVDKPVTAEQRARLQVDGQETIKYRRVDLTCGEHVLSQADNWYVPARLTPEMNRLLETTTTPFGRAVLDLKPTRQTIAAEILWSPLPAGWETGAREETCPPGDRLGLDAVPAELFRHRAVLTAADGRPFSEVVETYQRAVLDFPGGPLGK